MEDKQNQHREDLRESEHHSLYKHLHDGGREKEEEWSAKPPKTKGIWDLVRVHLTRGGAEGDGHHDVSEREDDHQYVEDQPWLSYKSLPANQIELEAAVEEEHEETQDLDALRDSAVELRHSPSGVSEVDVRGLGEGGGELEEGQEEVDKDGQA